MELLSTKAPSRGRRCASGHAKVKVPEGVQ